MRKILSPILQLSILFLFGCGGDISTTNDTGTTPDTTSTTEDNTAPDNFSNRDCPINGNILEGNKLVLADRNLIAYIVADSTTKDDELGDSHRILYIYNSENCEQVEKITLPVNTSPDYAYYLAKINYNNSSNLLGIRGFDKIYCYDLEAKKLLPALTPAYKSERYGEDAQSGMILRIEVWEDNLIGYARDEGTFAFDLQDKDAPKNVLPFAEYEVNETEFASLFLFPSNDGGTQCLLPKFDVAKDEFSINPLLTKPAELETNIPESARNNRHLVIRMKDENKTPLAFDLMEYKKMNLPDDIAAKNTQGILDWMRGG
jgi:hypothetical protein